MPPLWGGLAGRKIFSGKVLTFDLIYAIIYTERGKEVEIMKLIATVNNLPENINRFAWIVARAVDGELWYWSSYNDLESAKESAIQFDGIVLKVEV